MKLTDSADLICLGVIITIIIIQDSVSHIIRECPEQDLAVEAFPSLCVRVFFFFLIRRDVSLPSHLFHLSAALAPVIMVPLGW